MKLMTHEFNTLFKKYPLYSQQDNKDPLIITKLFDTCGSATWYLTEYDPVDKIAFGYVTGMIADEWGYVSLIELEDIRHPQFGIARIERDLYFNKSSFRDVLKPH